MVSVLTNVQPAIFTTMDITTDGFGFMLAVGDLTWVPFVYSLQARYLVFRPVELDLASTVGILAVNALGYWIFRDANGEKNNFRNGKNPKSEWSNLVTVPVTDSLRNRPEILYDGEGIQVTHVGLVGALAPPKLLVRFAILFSGKGDAHSASAS